MRPSPIRLVRRRSSRSSLTSSSCYGEERLLADITVDGRAPPQLASANTVGSEESGAGDGSIQIQANRISRADS